MSFQSVHDLLTPPSIVRKTKFWDWFDGDSLKSWWTTRDVVGTGTFAMSDAVDEGFKISTGGSSGDRSEIYFNDIRHYSETGSIIIWVAKAVDSTNALTDIGSTNDGTTTAYSIIRFHTGQANWNYLSKGAGAGSIDLGIARDNNFNEWKISHNTASVTIFNNDILTGVATSNIPTSRQQPYAASGAIEAAAKDLLLRRCEAYNT